MNESSFLAWSWKCQTNCKDLHLRHPNLNKTIPGSSYIAFFEFSATCNQILQYGCKNEPASITGVHPVPCRDNFLRSPVPSYGIVVACVCFFVPAFAVPSEIRSAEQSIALSVNMLFAFFIVQLFLPTG